MIIALLTESLFDHLYHGDLIDGQHLDRTRDPRLHHFMRWGYPTELYTRRVRTDPEVNIILRGVSCLSKH
jgi:hypothetical protein